MVRVVVVPAVAVVAAFSIKLLACKLALASRNATVLAVGALVTLTAEGVAGLPVALPITLLAPNVAIFARVTAPAAMVVATEPAAVVTSPVSAGNCAAASVPVSEVAARDLLVKV